MAMLWPSLGAGQTVLPFNFLHGEDAGGLTTHPKDVCAHGSTHKHAAPMGEPCCLHSHPLGPHGSNYKFNLDCRSRSTVLKAAGAELLKLLKVLAGVGQGGLLSPDFQAFKSR